MFGGRFSLKVPLLNEYKYGLCRRKLLQSWFGGPIVRLAPFLIHFIQTLLWFLPVVFAIPFIVLDSVRVWDAYFLALVYSTGMGIMMVCMEMVLIFVMRRHTDMEPRVQQDYETEEVDIESICSSEAIFFVFDSRKKVDIILRPISSMIISYIGCYIFFPTVLQKTFSLPGTVVLIVIGWLVFCLAHYSVIVRLPPETAVYRATSPYFLRQQYRPLYIMIIGIAIILVEALVTSNKAVYLYILYCSYCVLPLGWILGILPPLDALFPWIMEIVLVRLLGGSPMATDLRLAIDFSMAVVAVVIGIAVTDATTSLLLLTGFGFILSQSMYSYTRALLYQMSCICNSKLEKFIKSKTQKVFSKTLLSFTGLGDIHKLNKSFVCSVFVSLAKNSFALLCSILIVHYTSVINTSSSGRDDLARGMAIAWITTSVVVFINDHLQRIYFLGIVKNFLSPRLSTNLMKFNRMKTCTDMFGIIRKIMILYLAPLLAMALLGVTMGQIPISIIERLAVARLLRKMWQNTERVLSELTVVSVVILVTGHQISVGFPILTLIVGISIDVAVDFLHKIVFVGKLLLTYFTLHKQRTYTIISCFIFVCNFIFFPVLLMIIFLTSVVAAPLLPLFSLPIFLIGFPRTRRFWPSLTDYGTVSVKTADSIYYQEVELELGAALSRSLSCGHITSQPGTQILFRFDNRLGLITILQHNYNSCTINLRGLEFQETSCHSEEATVIDAMFEKIHSNYPINKALRSTLIPADTRVIKTYSDARNILTGIIDQPDALKKFSSNLSKALTWVFYHYLIKRSIPVSSSSNTIQQFVVRPRSSDHLKAIHSHIEEESKHTEKTEIQNFTDSNYARTVEFRKHEVIEKTKTTENLDGRNETHGDTPLENDLETIASNFELTESSSDSVVSAVKPNLIHRPRKVKVHPISAIASSESGKYPGLNIAVTSTRAASISSESNGGIGGVRNTEAATLGAPAPPIGQRKTNSSCCFPTEWYAHLKSRYRDLDSKDDNFLHEIVEDSFNFLYVSSGQWSLNAHGNISPQQIVQGFQGIFSQKEESNWIRDNSDFMKKALKAYRYAVKLMYDEGSLGEVESLEELVDYLEDYDCNWCITTEKEGEWNAAIFSKHPHLFSIDHDPDGNKYMAHVLSLQDTAVHFGTLNRAALQGMWANMNFELVYLTNDDEERYSIQAHPFLLRNISSQLCDPPLGYCVYSSGLMTIPST